MRRTASYTTTPQENTYTSQIINTLLNAKNEGKAKNTQRVIASSLRQIAKGADLNNPDAVKAYIANANVCGATKNKLALSYTWFCKTNGLEWKQPYFKHERRIPMIPSTDAVNKIISACTKKYATLFTILAETGLEAQELVTTRRQDIDAERGIINVVGCKGHNSRSIKLKTPTAQMVREYLATYTSEYPFPSSHALGEAWRDTRNKLADTLKEPQLRNVPMRNLRHRFATMKYDETKDVLLVKSLLGHKKLETTMFYVQLMTFNAEEEYTCKIAQNVKESADLIEHGFQYVQDKDGLSLYRKRK